MRVTLVFLIVFCGVWAKGQIKEINPAIGWNYIKSQEFDMADGSWYNTDFPAEVGYDYNFILNHKLDSISATIQIFNLQDEMVYSNTSDLSTKLLDMPFDVKEEGMYRVFFFIDDNKTGAKTHKTQLMLIRRKKV